MTNNSLLLILWDIQIRKTFPNFSKWWRQMIDGNFLWFSCWLMNTSHLKSNIGTLILLLKCHHQSEERPFFGLSFKVVSPKWNFTNQLLTTRSIITPSSYRLHICFTVATWQICIFISPSLIYYAPHKAIVEWLTELYKLKFISFRVTANENNRILIDSTL